MLSCKVRVALDRDDRVIESGRDRNHGPGAVRAEHCTAHCTIRVTVTAFICSIYFLLSLAISLLLFLFPHLLLFHFYFRTSQLFRFPVFELFCTISFYSSNLLCYFVFFRDSEWPPIREIDGTVLGLDKVDS